MTATTSTSSAASAARESKDVRDGSTTTAPYGTRSRNRPGVARPNYAEDHADLDADLVHAAAPAATPAATAADGGRPVSSQAATPAPNTAAIPGTSTFSVTPTPSNNSIVNGHDSSAMANSNAAHGADNASATPATQPPRRRKNAANHAANNLHAAAGAAAPPSQAVQRRAGPVTANHPPVELPMMTFGKSGALLKNGALYDDSGTALSVDGTLPALAAAFRVSLDASLIAT